MEHDGDDALVAKTRGELDGDHVERRLRHGVADVAPHRLADLHRSDLRRHVDDPRVGGATKLRQQAATEQPGADSVDLDLADQLLGRLQEHVASGLVGTEVAGVDAGIVEQHVDRLIADRLDEVGDRLLVAHVDGVHVLGHSRKFWRGVGVATPGDDAVAAAGEHPCQFEPESAVRSGDDDGAHRPTFREFGDHLGNGSAASHGVDAGAGVERHRSRGCRPCHASVTAWRT